VSTTYPYTLVHICVRQHEYLVSLMYVERLDGVQSASASLSPLPPPSRIAVHTYLHDKSKMRKRKEKKRKRKGKKKKKQIGTNHTYPLDITTPDIYYIHETTQHCTKITSSCCLQCLQIFSLPRSRVAQRRHSMYMVHRQKGASIGV
jgi:hypothetical protein